MLGTKETGRYTMSIRRHITKKKILFSAVLAAVMLTGCRNIPETAGHIGQEEIVTGESVYNIPVREYTLQSEDDVVKAGEYQSGQQGDSKREQQEIRAVGASENRPQQEKSRQEKPLPPEGWELELASEDWGLSFGEPGSQPVGNAAAEDLAWYDAYYIGDDSNKVIYLTFDCGYENGNTEPILDALKKHDVQATFFVVGHFLETAPDIAKRMAEEGHTVGNHTYHHPDMSTISDPENFQKEMNDVADLFYEITGTKLSMYYRPPQGKCNTENLKMAQELGYSTVFWSLAYVDWNQDDQPSREEAFDKLTTRVHPGAVVLLHNTSQTNGEILDELLTKWEDMGYSFEPLSKLTQRQTLL